MNKTKTTSVEYTITLKDLVDKLGLTGEAESIESHGPWHKGGMTYRPSEANEKYNALPSAERTDVTIKMKNTVNHE